MINWEKCLLEDNKQIVDAVKIIDKGGAKIALIVNKSSALVGTITDYDVRQAILNGISLENCVSKIMNNQPKFAGVDDLDDVIFEKMRIMNIRQIPIIDVDKKVMGLKLISEFNGNGNKKTNPVLIMAGGLGSRLRPLTNNCPKPLLKIGNKTILEIILENFKKEGFEKFFFSVNYKSEMIKNYFGDGRKFGVSIKYLEEKKRLGTAGALSLLSKEINEPIIVMNGDLLTRVNFGQLLEFHYKHNALATMCVREYRYQVPYGVIKFDNWQMKELQEKPDFVEFVNAGIYVLNPTLLNRVPHDEYFDMTELFNNIIDNDEKALVFPIREYWMDVGRIEDFKKAQEDFI